MTTQTLLEQLNMFRKSNPLFVADQYIINYLNCIADYLLIQSKKQNKISVPCKSNGKETTAVKSNKLEKAIIK